MTSDYDPQSADARLEPSRPFTVAVDGAIIRGVQTGEGSPVLLLHGFPQTRLEWRHLWSELSSRHTVVATDLRGYGASEALDDDFTFRAMARDQVLTMAALGHDRFHVVGHDRGARVAHRMSADSPAQIRSVTLIDIVPASVVWGKMDAEVARTYWHWAFLAQSDEAIDAMVAAAPAHLLRACMGPAIRSGAIPPDVLREYESAASRPSVQRAFLADYRAAAGADLVIDAEEPTTTDTPALVAWGAQSAVPRIADPRRAWADILPNARFAEIQSGHFIPEQNPRALLDHLLPFLRDADVNP